MFSLWGYLSAPRRLLGSETFGEIKAASLKQLRQLEDEFKIVKFLSAIKIKKHGWLGAHFILKAQPDSFVVRFRKLQGFDVGTCSKLGLCRGEGLRNVGCENHLQLRKRTRYLCHFVIQPQPVLPHRVVVLVASLNSEQMLYFRLAVWPPSAGFQISHNPCRMDLKQSKYKCRMSQNDIKDWLQI